MTYMYCDVCSSVTPCKKSGVVGADLTCMACGFTDKLAHFRSHRCEGCGALLYAPLGMEAMPSCPCASAAQDGLAAQKAHRPPEKDTDEEGEAEEMEEAEEEEAEDDMKNSAYPVLTCPRCSASLTSTDGQHYGPCPVCAETPSQAYVSQQLYFLSQKQEPIIIKWDPAPEELVYVHHHASRIPANSLLIVNPDQIAVYVSGGQRVVLDEPQTYALFNDDLDTGAVARAINEGTLSLPPLALKLNTRIIFFDNRRHECKILVSNRIPGSSFRIALPVTLYITISKASALLKNALNLNDQVNVSDYLRARVTDRIQALLIDAISQIPREEAGEAETEQDIVNIVRRTLNREEEGILESANRRLIADFGVAIDLLDIHYLEAVCTRKA